MLKIKILFSGKWDKDDILVGEMSSSRVVDDSLEDSAKDTWEEMLRTAASSNQQLWDSEVYRFKKSEIVNSKLTLQFSTIPFSIRLGMNKHTDMVKSLGVGCAPKALFTSVLVETADNKFVFVEKSNKYFTDKKYAWVGGVLSKSEKEILSGADLIESAYIEVIEELGVEKDYISDIHLSAGYLSENWNTCFLFSSKLSLSSEEVRQAFAKQNDGEAKSLVFLDKNNLSMVTDIFEDKDRIKISVLDLV